MGKKSKSKQNLKSAETAEEFSESANTSSKSTVSTTSATEVSISVGTEEVTFSVSRDSSKDVIADPFEEIKKAIDSSNDKMSGLQDSLSENRTRLAAMLGLGDIESSPRSSEVSPVKRTPETSFLDDGSDKSFQFFALEKENKEQKKLIDQLKRDKAISDLAVVEKAKLLAEKTKEAEKLQQEVTQLSTKNSEITAIHSHIREIDTYIHASCMELHEFNGTTVEGAYSGSGHDLQHNSKRIVRLMSLLSTLTTQLKNKTANLTSANTRIEELKQLVAEHKQDVADANHAIHELEEDLQKEGDKFAKAKEVSQNIITALKTQVADLKAKNANAAESAGSGTPSPSSGPVAAGVSAGNLLLTAEVDELKTELAALKAKLAQSSARSHEELESVRGELLSTITELNTANHSLAESYTQHAEQEAAWNNREKSLREEVDKLQKDLMASQEEAQALEKRAQQLQTLYQQSLADKKAAAAGPASPKKDASSSSSSSASNLNAGAVADLQSQLAQLQQENQDLRSNLSDLSDSHSTSVAEYTKRINELQNHLTSAEGSSSAKIQELTASLKASTDALSSHMSAKSSESKNSEKLIAALEMALENSKKEVVAVTTKNAELENRIADQHRALQDKKNSRSNSLVDNSNSEELSLLRRELMTKSAEVLELRERVSELTASSSKLQEDLLAQQKAAMLSESQHNAEVLKMLSELAELKSAHSVELEAAKAKLTRAKSEAQQLRVAGGEGDHSSTARLAETKVAFTKDAFRAHLRANGVKVFFWDDMFSLMRKLEELHSNPHHPITYVSDLVEITTGHAGSTAEPTPEVSPKGAFSVTGTPAVSVPTASNTSHPAVTPRKRSVASFTPRKSSTTKKTPSSKRTSFFGEDSEAENQQNDGNSRRTPVTAKASFHYGGSFASTPFQSLAATKAVKHTPEVKPHAAWRSACVDKADPFGDLKEKTKSMRVSYKETQEKFNSFKASSPVNNLTGSPTSFYNNKANIDRFLEANGNNEASVEGTEKYLESIGAVVVSDNEEED